MTHCLPGDDLDRCGDVAMQPGKALKMSPADDSWETTQELQAVERHGPCLASKEGRYRGSITGLRQIGKLSTEIVRVGQDREGRRSRSRIR